MVKLPKLKPGDKVAILSPSFAAPGKWPHVHELGLKRLQEVFNLAPVEYPTTRKLGASTKERARDLIDAFRDPNIKGIITTIGGNDQVTYVKDLSREPFVQNPKPFFGYSDNSHFQNFLWLQGVPSYYGGSLFTQFAMQKRMDEYTVQHLKHALFEQREVELAASPVFNDVGLNWNDQSTLGDERVYEKNEGWIWSGSGSAEGITWGGCVESVDEMLRHGVPIPSNTDFENIILMTETSEEVPSGDYVHRVYRALGERGILARVKGVIVGRPKAWEFNKQLNADDKSAYKLEQREIVESTVRKYNQTCVIVQNMDFGHTDPQIPMPYGMQVRIDSANKQIFATF